jgi:hypothetical protein
VHPLFTALLAFHVGGLIALAVAGRVLGPPVDWRTAGVPATALILLGLLWAAHVRRPGPAREWIVPETLLAVGMVIIASSWLGPAQYVAASIRRPLVDAQLAAMDAALGVDVATLAMWTRAHPLVSVVLSLAYATLIVQFAIVQLVAGLGLRDRSAVWEYAWHFTVCAAVTLLSSALWPAASAFQYFGFTSTLPQARFIAHFAALRAGTMASVDFQNLEGLISVPSFHVLGALMITWVLRKHWLTRAIAIPVNLLLIAATFLSGAHYLIDALVAIPVFAASVWTWRAWGQRLLPPSSADAKISQTEPAGGRPRRT